MSCLNLHCVKTNLNLGTQTELVTLGTDATVYIRLLFTYVHCTMYNTGISGTRQKFIFLGQCVQARHQFKSDLLKQCLILLGYLVIGNEESPVVDPARVHPRLRLQVSQNLGTKQTSFKRHLRSNENLYKNVHISSVMSKNGKRN